jgi:hypothetical protein
LNPRAPLLTAAVCAFALFGPIAARAEDLNEEALAKIAQNPVANLISIPLQENANLNAGPFDHELNVLNIQPVVLFDITDDWNIITRTILPVISQPGFSPEQDRSNGLGDVQISTFLTSSKPGAWIWAIGAIAQLPTHTDPQLGNDHAGFGPTFAILRLEAGSPWVFGVLLNNVWSTGNSHSPAYNNGLIQPFINYNFKGAYLTTSPVITANWEADRGSQKFTVPVGGGVGKVFKIGSQRVNAQVGAYYNFVRPDFAPNWQIRLQAQLMFPK